MTQPKFRKNQRVSVVREHKKFGTYGLPTPFPQPGRIVLIDREDNEPVHTVRLVNFPNDGDFYVPESMLDPMEGTNAE